MACFYFGNSARARMRPSHTAATQQANESAMFRQALNALYRTFVSGQPDVLRIPLLPLEGQKLHLEALAEVKLTADGIIDEKILCAFALDAAIENQIRAVDDRKSLAHIVIGDHDRKARFAQVYDNLLHIVDGDGIHAAERLIEHQQFRLRDERTRNC